MSLPILVPTRDEFVKAVERYRGTMLMPIHLTGDLVTPQQELGMLQEIYRTLIEHRRRIAASQGLFSCSDCQHYEGEHHAEDCNRRSLGVITRPAHWRPSSTEPVQIVELAPQPCPEVGPDGRPCIYMQLPGVGFCAQHRPKTT